VVTNQLQVERRTVKVRRSKTDVLPLHITMASSHVVNREWLSQPVDNTRRSIRESMVVGQLFIAVQWWYFCLVSYF